MKNGEGHSEFPASAHARPADTGGIQSLPAQKRRQPRVRRRLQSCYLGSRVYREGPHAHTQSLPSEDRDTAGIRIPAVGPDANRAFCDSCLDNLSLCFFLQSDSLQSDSLWVQNSSPSPVQDPSPTPVQNPAPSLQIAQIGSATGTEKN